MKKAELSMTMIVYAVLALVILIVLIFIFKDQITKSSGGITQAGKNIGDKADECTKFPLPPECNNILNTPSQPAAPATSPTPAAS